MSKTESRPAESKPWEFPKGKSGNPGGRPKKARELAATIEKALSDRSSNPAIRNAAVERVLDILAQTEDEKTAILAARFLFEYWIGRPRQQVEVTGENGGAVQIKAAAAEVSSLLASLAARDSKG